MIKSELWDKAAAFHGHVCGGLTIGYQAAVYAIKLLDLKFSEDEDVVCISENDACGSWMQCWKRKPSFPHERKAGLFIL